MAELVVERGYAAVTVTDVVARARVSKRTFYEQFAEREDCFLATYEALAEEPLRRITEAAGVAAAQSLGLREQVERATGAYLEAMAEQPGLTRALLTQIASVGPRGRAVRREVLRRFADQLLVLAQEAHRLRFGVAPLTRPLALALVGGINELVLDALEGAEGEEIADGIEGAVAELARTVADLVVAVLTREGAAVSPGPRSG